MDEETMNSDDSYSDDDEEEELDPRIQDELEKLNAATNSINHLEAELDEARAVFRQTLAGATYHLNGVAQKLGKCVDKSRPFYEAYRQLRQSHGHLQKSTNQFERASGMTIAAKSRVMEAEKRVFGAGAKRTFDTALQEMLNQATIEVNEAEKLKRDSWKQHQEDLKAYRDLQFKVKKLYKKLKSSVDKAKPYFEQKREFDRHLWQLKLRVDSILIGLSGAKENYSACLKSLEVISDDIHEKRKSKRMETMLSKLQERESGVGADSSTEDETSLHASNLDLDFDSSLNFDKLDGLSNDLADCEMSATRAASCSDLEKMSSPCSFPDRGNLPSDTRVVYGLESSGSDNNKDLKEQTNNEENSNEYSKNAMKNEVEQTEVDSVANQESPAIMINQLGINDEPNNESTRDESSVAGKRSPLDLPNLEESARKESSVVEEGAGQDQTDVDEDKLSVVEEKSCQEQLSRDELTTRDESCADEAIAQDRIYHDDSPQTDESSALEETSQNQALDNEPTAKDQSNDSIEDASQDQASHDELPQTKESAVSVETPQNQAKALDGNDNSESSSQDTASHDELTTTDESHVVKDTPQDEAIPGELTKDES